MNKFVKYILIAFLATSTVSLSAEDKLSLEARAEAGDVKAMLELSKENLNVPLTRAYSSGSKNLYFAFYWANKAYEAGSVDAIERLAVCYEKGIGTPIDLDKALSLYTQAVEKGSPDALARLATFHTPDPRDESLSKYINEAKAKALSADFLKIIDERDDLDIELYIYAIKTYLEGKLCDKDIGKAVSIIEKYYDLDAKGYPYYALNDAITHCYLKGIGVDKDEAKALELYNKISARRDSSSFLSIAYELGIFKPATGKDYSDLASSYLSKIYSEFKPLYDDDNEKAKHFWQKSADMGFYFAYIGLARIYSNEGNEAKAFELKLKCYELIPENPTSYEAFVALNLADAYKEGKGTPKNIEKAIEIYEKFSSKDIHFIDYKLGILYFEIENYEKAFKHLSKVLGLIPSEEFYSTLARCYEDGLGTKKDIAKAIENYEKAIPLAHEKEALQAKIEELSKEIGTKAPKRVAISTLDKKALSGDVEAMYELATRYLNFKDMRGASFSKGGDKSGFYWYAKAYENGNIDAIEKLGRCYEQGIGTNKDLDKALALYQEAWEKGNTLGLLRLCNVYMPVFQFGSLAAFKNAQKTRNENFDALVKLAKERNDLHLLIYDYLAIKLLEKKDKEAIYFLEKICNSEDIKTPNYDFSVNYTFLAYCYATGTLAEKDEAKALELLALFREKVPNIYSHGQPACLFVENLLGVAKLESDKDFFAIASIYDPNSNTVQGESSVFPQDSNQAIYYYEKAAAFANAEAMWHILNLARDGKEVDKKKAFDYALKFIEAPTDISSFDFRLAQALSYVANTYKKGVIVNKDLKKAFELYQKAANSNDIEAKINLAQFYFNGEVVAQDYAQAAKYLLEIKGLHSNANFFKMLGEIYERGLGGVDLDTEMAISNYKKALSFLKNPEEKGIVQSKINNLTKK